MSNLTPIIKNSFLQFSGAVLQSRALSDARDNMKPSARQIFYCMYTDGFTHNKPFKKTLKAIGSAFRVYIHGDSSAEGIIMRAAQPFAYRYPLVETEGSYGTLMSANSYAAPRYTSSRLSELADYLFADLDKDTIDEWRDNYDDTEKYPMVLPCKGFFPIVNGNFGLGVGMSASIPQYNLKEVNEALIKLLWDSDISFEEIYVAPDFATGAVLLNADDVKESHKIGRGYACKLRSVVSFDSKERCLTVTEIPYMVYTNTICEELEKIVNGEENPGIDRFNDLTGEKPLIKIYLNKNANPDKVLKYLFKNTSLQSHYGVNFTVLENGRYPKVFNWKQLLQAHLDHERTVYVRGFNFDLKKINARLHIIEGLLRAISVIDEVIQTIKQSQDSKSANCALQSLLSIDESQAKAILDIKLSRLAHLEIVKLENEQSGLFKERDRIKAILNDDTLLKKEIEKGLREVATKFGDARRTKILNIAKEDEEPTEINQLQVSLTNRGNMFVAVVSSLYTQRRGGVGNKFKLEDGEYVTNTETINSNEELLLFSNAGNVYHCKIANIPVDQKTHVQQVIPCKDWERICAITAASRKPNKPYILFFTKQGLIKKSDISEYNITRNAGLKALTLDAKDEIVDVLFTDNEKVGILTETGNFVIIETESIRSIGRVARGVKAIALNDGDGVASVHVIPNETTFLASISGDGLFKRTPIYEFSAQGRGTKGSKIQKLNDGDYMVDFYPILENDTTVLVASTNACIKLTINDIPIFTKGALGNKSIKIGPKSKVIGISIY